ncbi:MAG TPA: LexA family transcriptional regulator [Cyclobacteriaceae bacterium]
MLSDRIKALRIAEGFTQAELADKMKIARLTIINWEKGITAPDGKEIKALSKIFNTDLTKLTFEHGSGGNEKEESKNQETKNKGLIPFYDAVAVGGTSMLAEQVAVHEPAEFINPGTWFKAATGALRVYGHSMFPKYPAGSIIAFRDTIKFDPNLIHYGEDYVIELDDRRIVKRVQKSKTKGCIQVNSYNTMKDDTGSSVYAPYDISLNKITRMYTVLGIIILEASM